MYVTRFGQPGEASTRNRLYRCVTSQQLLELRLRPWPFRIEFPTSRRRQERVVLGISSAPLGASEQSPRKSRSGYRKVTVTLPPEQEQFLSEFAYKLRNKGGRKLANTEIVRAAISALETLEDSDSLDLEGIQDEDQLMRAILKAAQNVPKGH